MAETSTPDIRVAAAGDIDRVTEILVGAFYRDPTWSWAFPDDDRRREQHRSLWRLMVEGAMRYPTVWLNADATATAVWIPPGGSEMSPAQEAALKPLVSDLLGEGADRVNDAFDRFEQAHPDGPEYYYLTLLGTDPLRRGRGLGLGLLEESLKVIDREQKPAYLEASNEVNVPLYARYGFEVAGSFQLPEDGPEVTTMWREPQPLPG
ncbi:MAG: GNAT family N-acetyltransferase [Solirubrobacterales bacterium]